jgi:ribonuclease J
MFAVVLNISSKNKKIIGKPKFLSRGFIYLKGSHELLKELETLIFDVHRDWERMSQKGKRFEEKALVKKLERELSRVIYKKTEREPIILVAII